MKTITPEQTALIPICREKWRQIGLSMLKIDNNIDIEPIYLLNMIIKHPGYKPPDSSVQK
ncbi:hypothetical protein QT972_22255 [Microcoleus sp. herbarium7]|uniref:hypothetical protein n=1 Tax=unclassified Microcoleus TaxID=2642155 RepID=UPI002FD45738